MAENFQKQARDQFSALIAAGVKHFPKPVEGFGVDHRMGEPEASVGVDFEKTVLGCKACALSNDRLCVVARNPQTAIGAARYLAVADFAELADEAAGKPFSDEGQGSVLLRLFEKLGIAEQIFKSYAVKCVPRKGIPAGTISACAGHLKFEISTLRPDAILLFGPRAKKSFEIATGESLSQLEEIGRIETRTSLVFVMPSVGELAMYPEWRGTVWRLLQPLRR